MKNLCATDAERSGSPSPSGRRKGKGTAFPQLLRLGRNGMPPPMYKTACAIALLFALGCGEAPSNQFLTWSSEHFDYHARVDDPSVEPGVLEALEAHGELVAQKLGRQPQEWSKVHYYKYRDLHDLHANSPCEGSQAGCQFRAKGGPNQLHSPLSIDEHELTHAYTDSLGRPPDFLTEGIAISVSCNPGVEQYYSFHDGPTWLTQKWSDSLLPTSFDVGLTQAPFGEFTTWLVDSFGTHAYSTLYYSLPRTATREQVAAGFVDAYGISIDDLWKSFVGAPGHRTCLAWAACAATSTVSSAAPSTLTPTRLTTSGSEFRPGLPIPPAGLLVSALEGELPVVRPCTPEGALPDHYGYWPVLNHAVAAFLPARDGYVLAERNQLLTPERGDLHSRLDIAALPPVGTSVDCSNSPRISTPNAEIGLVIWPQSPMTLELSSLHADLWRSSVRIEALDPGEVVVEVCQSCQDHTLHDCAPVPGGFPVDGPASPWLRIQWTAPNNGILVLGAIWHA